MITDQPIDEAFAPAPPGEAVTLRALTRALTFADGFQLDFVVCNHAPLRDRLMEEVKAELPGKHIRMLPLSSEPDVRFLDILREQMRGAAPGAVFAYGIENWLPAGDAARRSAFIQGLNVNRNAIAAALPCPLVLWLPEHVLLTISRASPDFFSIHSGIFTFTPDARDRDQAARLASSIGLTGALGLPYRAKLDRLDDLRRTLEGYAALPMQQRDQYAEMRLLDGIVTLEMALGRYREAELSVSDLIERQRTLLGEERPDTLGSMNNLAIVYYRTGRLDEAESLHRQVLAGREEVLGQTHPDTLDSLNNLALVFEDQGRLTEAEPLLVRVLQGRNEVLGRFHPATLTSGANLATLYEMQGRFSQAESLHRKTLEDRSHALGMEHPDTLSSMNNLGICYARQGRYSEAERMFRMALDERRRMSGPMHPDTMQVANNLVKLLRDMGKTMEADEVLREVVVAQVSTGDAPKPLAGAGQGVGAP